MGLKKMVISNLNEGDQLKFKWFLRREDIEALVPEDGLDRKMKKLMLKRLAQSQAQYPDCDCIITDLGDGTKFEISVSVFPPGFLDRCKLLAVTEH